MRVVENWFWHVLRIKIGVYEAMQEEGDEETRFMEEENLFEMM